MPCQLCEGAAEAKLYRMQKRKTTLDVIRFGNLLLATQWRESVLFGQLCGEDGNPGWRGRGGC